jgi:hypothetical protein
MPEESSSVAIAVKEFPLSLKDAKTGRRRRV